MTIDPIAELEAARAQIHADAQAFRDRRDQLDELAQSIEAVTATARSPRGEVTVTAAPSGVVLSVVFSDDALSSGRSSLERLVLQTITQAQRAAADEAARLTAETMGPDSALASEMARDADRRFGQPGGATFGY